MRVIRLIIYEGPAHALAEQFARSLPEGVRDGGRVKITILTLGEGNPAIVQDLIQQFSTAQTEGGEPPTDGQ